MCDINNFVIFSVVNFFVTKYKRNNVHLLYIIMCLWAYLAKIYDDFIGEGCIWNNFHTVIFLFVVFIC